jgi:hypothetical protein
VATPLLDVKKNSDYLYREQQFGSSSYYYWQMPNGPVPKMPLRLEYLTYGPKPKFLLEPECVLWRWLFCLLFAIFFFLV